MKYFGTRGRFQVGWSLSPPSCLLPPSARAHPLFTCIISRICVTGILWLLQSSLKSSIQLLAPSKENTRQNLLAGDASRDWDPSAQIPSH
jgi:hypothetical protein